MQHIVLETTNDPSEIVRQVHVVHPEKDNRVYLIKVDTDGDVESLFSIGMGTDCGMYWMVQEHLNRSVDAKEKAWCADFNDDRALLEWAQHFVRKGYVGVAVYGKNGVYQYDPTCNEANKFSGGRKDFVELIGNRKVALK